jgi:hypothetical protein
MTSYNSALATSGGQAFSITLSDGSIFNFTLSASGTTTLDPRAAPSWTGSAVGNTAFLGIPNKPILYTNTGGIANLTMSNITVTPPSSGVSTGIYKVVIADGESTNGGESLTYTTNGGLWEQVDQVQNGSSTIYPGVTNTGTTYTNTGAAGTVGAYIVGSQSPTTVTVQLEAGGLQGIMIAVQYATISTNKVIVGGRANPADQFAFGTKATSNGSIISSATSTGAALGPFSSSVSTISSSVPVTVFEEMAPGSVSTLAQYTTSFTCTNGNAGSPTPLPTNQPITSYGVATIAYGDSIACTFTNTPKPATVAVRKMTVGAIGGAFSFAATNLTSAPPAITTTATNTAFPASPTAINVTSYNTDVTITETAAANFTLTSATCSDANRAVTGNPVSFGSSAGNVVTIPAANVVAGAQITCTLTNTLNTAAAATVAVQKITMGAAGGAFTFTSTNLRSTPSAITTSSAGTAYPTVTAPIVVTTVGNQVRITETLAANFTIVSASCLDANAATSGNPTTAFGNLVGSQLTIPATNIRAGAQITCVFTNIVDPAIPVVAIQKVTSVVPGGPFAFTGTNLTGAIPSISTTSAATAAPAAPNYISVTSITTPVTLTEAANSNFNLVSGTCTDTNSATSGNPASFGSIAGNVITVPVANLVPFARILCTFTNAPKPPTVALQKITAGSVGGPFTFTAINLASNPANITTTASNTATPASPTAIQVTTVNSQVQITEAANPRFNSTAATCTDSNAAFTGNPASFGSLAGTVLTIPAANILPAAVIVCSITNTAVQATVTVQKITTNVPGGPFVFAVSNLAAAPANISTTATATAAPAAPMALTVSTLNSPVLISENTNPYFSFSGATCSDANAAVTGNPATFGTVTGQLLTIPAANVLPAAVINCTFTNAGNAPRIRLQKVLSASGRIAASDQFRLAVTGTGAPAAINTTGTGAAITSAPISFTATANSAYSLTETMATGSASLLTAYAQIISCNNNNATGTNVSGLTSLPINFTIQAADDVQCTITNNGSPTPVLTINKTFSTATTPVVLGQTIVYTYTVSNAGNVSIANVQVNDMHGTPAAPIALGTSGITAETLTVPGPLGAGASTDTTPNDGVWTNLAPGATVRFNYTHTVTQAEIDNG